MLKEDEKAQKIAELKELVTGGTLNCKLMGEIIKVGIELIVEDFIALNQRDRERKLAIESVTFREEKTKF